MIEPVDAVVTWVDGFDVAHQNKLTAYLNAMGVKRPIEAEPTRYNQRGEIEYCIKAILQFCPWIRTIFIVTDAQTPSIVHQLQHTEHGGKIKIVDHQEIFFGYEECLPTFNSLSIESLLWRIPGLSENFIYFNDDFILTRPVQYSDFFDKGKIIQRGSVKRRRSHTYNLLKKIFKLKEDNVHRCVQENSAMLAGIKKLFLDVPHIPFPLKKSIFDSYFSHFPELLSENIRYPFRDKQQFSPISLAYHLEMKNKNSIIDPVNRSVRIEAKAHSLEKIQRKLIQLETDPRLFCINIQSLDLASPVQEQTIIRYIHKIIR